MSKLQSLIKAAILKKVQQELEKKQPGILLPNVPGADRDRTQEVVPISDADVIDYKNRQPGDDPKIGGQFQKLQGKFRAEALTPGSSEKDLQFWRRQHPDKHKEQLLSNLTRSFSGGAVASTPSKHAFVGHVKTNENPPDLEQKVREHEGNHLVFHAIEKKYGKEGKEKFLDHILSNFKPETVRHFYKKYQSHYPNIDSLALKEEIANYMHNTLSGKTQREYAFEGMPEHEMRALDQDLKGGFKRFAQSQKGIDESFFTGDRLAASEFKKSSLVKGVKQRLFPVHQEQADHKQAVGLTLPNNMEAWQRLNRPEQRKNLADMAQLPPNTMKRAVIDLSKKTATRRNQDTGELEFLMHRGIGNTERENAIDIPSRQTMHASHTSWTPVLEQAQEFATLRNKAYLPSGLLSAWIPQSAIATVPKHWGSYSAEDRGFPGGPNEYAKEHEVIVHPGNYELVHDRDVKKLVGQGKRDIKPGVYSLNQAINFRAKPNVDRADVAATYAQERAGGNFKKSTLIKGAMRRLAPWGQESRQTSESVQADLENWQDRGITHARSRLALAPVDESSRKRTLHKLSSMTPTRKNPDGTRSFLLHRGMDIVEYKNAKTSHLGKPAFQHRAESSWTPSPTISGGFAFDAGRERPSKKGAHVSAWVHENDIALMPNQYASSKGSDEYKYEQEVIVKPGGISPLVHKDDVAKLTGVDKDDEFTHPGGQILDNPDRMINFRQKSQGMFGTDPIARNKYIMPEFKRNRFKKSQLAKSELRKGKRGNWNEEGYSIFHVDHLGEDDDGDHVMVHAHIKGKPVGYAKFYHYDTGLLPDAVSVDRSHRRKGLASAMYRHAEAITGKTILNEGSKSALAEKFWDQPNRQFGNRFKKSLLVKGAAQRLFPFNPEKDLSEMDEESIARWQKLDPSTSEYEPGQPEISTKDQHKQLREDVPSFSGPAKNRSLLKLHGKTQSRRNPNTGDVEYLLHRGYGKGGEESLWHKHDDKQSDIPQRTSWTPHKEIAENFSKQHRGQTVSAWIPQNKIVNVPKQYGIVSVFPEQDRKVRSENRYFHEHEVIVEPGTYQHGTGPQASIDVEISRRGRQGETYPYQIREYAEARGRFKKSQLAKSPIKYEGELFNHPQQVKTSEEKPFVNEKTTQSLPNGLTHKILHGDQKTIHELYDKDKLVGTLTVVNNQVRDSQVSSEEQGRNYGKSLYSAALRHHGQLESDTLVSPAAAHQWQRLGAMNNVDYRPAPYLTNEEYQNWINEGMNPDSPHEPFKAQVTGQLDDKEAFPEVKPK